MTGVPTVVAVDPGGAVTNAVPHTGDKASLGPSSATARSGNVAVATWVNWEQMTVPGGVYLRAISMASAQVGFAAGELGRVLRTTDGGNTWHFVLNQGFPYYYYGVHALNERVVIISGFQNQSGEGIICWSEDGGDTWGPIIALPGPTGVKWLAHVHFVDDNYGIVEAAWAGGVHRTTTGGRTANDWTYVQPSGSWFAGTFTYLPDGRVWLAGIDVVHSPDHGVNWVHLPSASPVFDGPIAVLASGKGYIGGGQISTPVRGWVYGTSDGGNSWTPQPILDTPYPVRGLLLLDEQRGWAVGGNVYGNVGGVWGTTDGGQSWQLELDVGNEMLDLDWVRVDPQHIDVYVAGYISQIWRARLEYPQILVGDLNCDGQVNFGDINPFVLALTNLPAYQQQFPGCPFENRDINGDGKFDFGDINPFVRLLTGS